MAENPIQTLKRATGLLVRLGGEESSGWLPPDAARPLPTPARDVLVDFKITSDGAAGYLLIFQAQDGSFCWDHWYESIEAAELAAHEFGVAPSAWIPAE